MATTELVVPRNTATLVDLLGDLIAEKSLQPGQRLPPIRELASRFGVKAGMVRDALLDAQGRGLVKVLPRLGAFVQSTEGTSNSESIFERMRHNVYEQLNAHDQNLFHVLDTRECLELAIITRAAERRELPDLFKLREILKEMASIPVSDEGPHYVALDLQFHLEIGRIAGNQLMTSMLGVLLEELKPHLARIRWSPSRRSETNESHARMYTSLVHGDVTMAQAEMRAHIRTAYDSLLDEIRVPPSMPPAHDPEE